MLKSILHVDMDAFYAAVEQRDRPQLKGKAVIVGASPKGRGVVSTCSYEARKYGVHSGMPISQAYKLCPDGVFLPVNISKYQKVSMEIHEILAKYTPIIEPIALDEAFLDVTYSKKLWGSAKHIGKCIQNEIEHKLGLTSSIGLSYNKFLAKVASDLNKPKGFVEITRDNYTNVIYPLPVSKIWGVGPKTKACLEQLNIKTIGDLAKQPVEFLEQWFGKIGQQLHELANGIDHREVEPYNVTKSIGKEITFNEDIDDITVIKKYIGKISENVGLRLRKNNLKGKVLLIKIRYADFTTITRRVTYESYLFNDGDIFINAFSLFKKSWSGAPLRLIGIYISNLISAAIEQLTLFKDTREDIVSRTMDKIREKHGQNSICRGCSFSITSLNKKGGYYDSR